MLILQHHKKRILYPENIPGNVLSLRAKKANAGQPPVLKTGGGSDLVVFSDMSKSRNSYYYSNSFSNGDFSNGTAGWTGTDGTSVLTSSNNTLFVTGKNTNAAPYVYGLTQLPTGNQNRTYYLRAKVKVTNSLCTKIEIIVDSSVVIATINSPTINTTYTISGTRTKTLTSQIVIIKHTYANTTNSDGSVMEIQQVMAIDLTALGLETLSAEQCDAIFPFTAVTNSASTPISVVKYNTWDWAQWVLRTNCVSSSNGLVFTSDGVNTPASTVPASLKGSTKYGVLMYSDYQGTGHYYLRVDTKYPLDWYASVGYLKGVITTDASITNQNIKIASNNVIYVSTVIVRDVRVFELPAGSTIEADFANPNLTASDLNAKYPMGVNEVMSTPRANDMLLMNVNKAVSNGLISGMNKIPVISSRGTGISYTNLVTNGDFSSGTTGWTQLNSTLSVVNGRLNITGDNTNGTAKAYQSYAYGSSPIGKVFYYRVKLNVTNALGSTVALRLMDAPAGNILGTLSQASAVNGTIYTFSGVATIPGTWTTNNVVFYVYNTYASASAGNLQVMEVQEAMMLDLSANTQIVSLASALGRASVADLTVDECSRIFPFTATSKTVAIDAVNASGWDGSDDYGAIANAPSLDIKTGEICISRTFRIATGATTKWMFDKNEGTEATTQYGLKYNATNGTIELWMEGAIRAATKLNSITQNVLYNVIFYKNNLGVIDSYLNKVQDVWYKGIGYSNLVTNGDFSGGTTGWTGQYCNLSSSENTLSSTGVGGTSGETPYVYQDTVDAIYGNKIYVSAKVKVTNANCQSIRLNCVGSTGGTSTTVYTLSLPVNGTQYTISGVLSVPSNFTGKVRVRVIHDYVDPATANTKVMMVQQIKAVDLTSLGLGHLTAAECDAIFPFVVSSGTTSDRTFTTALTSRPQIRLSGRASNATGTTHTDYSKEDMGTQCVYAAPSLDINKIIKAEWNVAKEYGLTKDKIWVDSEIWDDSTIWTDYIPQT